MLLLTEEGKSKLLRPSGVADMVVLPVIPALEAERKLLSLRPVWATQQDHVSKNYSVLTCTYLIFATIL